MMVSSKLQGSSSHSSPPSLILTISQEEGFLAKNMPEKRRNVKNRRRRGRENRRSSKIFEKRIVQMLDLIKTIIFFFSCKVNTRRKWHIFWKKLVHLLIIFKNKLFSLLLMKLNKNYLSFLFYFSISVIFNCMRNFKLFPPHPSYL